MGQFSMHFTGLQDFVQNEADLCKKNHAIAHTQL